MMRGPWRESGGRPAALSLYSFENLYRAYRECRRNKRNTVNALAFEVDAEANLLRLRDELEDHSYRPGPSICFITDGPKPREVFAADFRDRIVHHLLVGQVEPGFERRFIADSFACRKGKGVLAASDRLTAFLRSVTANGRRRGFALKLDIASFFPSIRKQTLFELLARHTHDLELLWLTETILFHDPTENYRFRWKGPRVPPPWSASYPIPQQKSLFGRGNECGLPIGNLTSQFWANVYLNEIDQFVKRAVKCRHYVRYVDDMILLGTDREEVDQWRAAVESFAIERLGLRLRPDTRPAFDVREGVDFVGWHTWRDHRVPRGRTVAALDRRLREFRGAMVLERYDGSMVVRAADPVLPWPRRSKMTSRMLQAVVNSYSGHLRHGEAWGRWQRLLAKHAWHRALLKGGGWTLKVRWRRPGRGRFTARYSRLVQDCGDEILLFCRVGRYVEMRGPQRLMATADLNMKPASVPRGAWALVCGFPVAAAARFERRALSVGRLVAWGDAERGVLRVGVPPSRPALRRTSPGLSMATGNFAPFCPTPG